MESIKVEIDLGALWIDEGEGGGQALGRAFAGKLKAAVKGAEDAAIAKVEAEAAKIIAQAVKRAAL